MNFVQDLNKGARQIEISVCDETVFSGELDKGCGNQVFDYGKSITIREEQGDTSMDTLDVPNKQKPQRLSPQLAGMMDNVSLHSDCDSPNQSVNYEDVQSPETGQEPEVRPGTRLINRATDPNIQLPVIGSTVCGNSPQQTSSNPKSKMDKEKLKLKVPTKKESKDFQKSPMKTDAPSLPETRKPKRESDTKDSSKESKGKWLY